MIEAPVAYYLIFALAAAAVLGFVALDIRAKRLIEEERSSRPAVSRN